jgi:hypothetical protein
MQQRLLLSTATGLATILLLTDVAAARIKLITLPVRQRVEIQLDHPNATLVEEERIVPLVKGVNQVDFSWANTRIDPNTIVFRVVVRDDDQDRKGQRARTAKPLDVKILSVSYPPNESALVWQVASSGSGSARVRISYLLGNLTKSFNYRAVVTHDEKLMTLRQYMRLKNFANEEFGATGIWAGFGPTFLKPIGINETKEMLMEKYLRVPVTKAYTCDPTEYGYIDRAKNKLRVPMHYVLTNDKANNLGQAPLEFGKVRIFQEDGRGSTAFIGEDWGKFTPLDDEMRLYVGTAQDIVVRRTIDKNVRHRVAGNLYDIEVVVKYEIENFKDVAVTLDVAESLKQIRAEVFRDTGRDVQWEPGDQTTFQGGPDQDKSTYDKKIFHAPLPARGADSKATKIVHKLHFVIKNEW